SRVPDPIVPLGLFRNRSFTVSVVSMFLVGFGFLGAVVFLPRWFQAVAGASATESGYNILPLLLGLIVSAIVSGQIVARTGHYKALIFGSLVVLAVGLYLMTQLRVDTNRQLMWLWMLITGIGIGPSFAVFTLVVQNAVSPDRIGVATSSLTFFQQIGGTIGLTISSTIFATRIVAELPVQLLAAGVPQPVVDQFAKGGDTGAITGTGDLGAAILAQIPPALRPQFEPLIPAIVDGIHQAFTIALASTFWVGIVGAIVAAGAVLLLREEPMRSTFEIEVPQAASEAEPAVG
ncbi:MAG TPA: MFS transporter, partial [Candidatus Binatia bacterium]|nr:MFS transporter [Candidatus Binatia bacterium]